MHALFHDALGLGLALLQPGSFRLVPHVSVLFTFRSPTGWFTWWARRQDRWLGGSG